MWMNYLSSKNWNPIVRLRWWHIYELKTSLLKSQRVPPLLKGSLYMITDTNPTLLCSLKKNGELFNHWWYSISKLSTWTETLSCLKQYQIHYLPNLWNPKILRASFLNQTNFSKFRIKIFRLPQLFKSWIIHYIVLKAHFIKKFHDVRSSYL